MPKRARKKKCPTCKISFSPASRGRTPTYCSAACRQAAYERRKYSRMTPSLLLGRDVDHIHTKQGIHDVVFDILRKAGVVADSPTQKKRPHLKLIASKEIDSEKD